MFIVIFTDEATHYEITLHEVTPSPSPSPSLPPSLSLSLYIYIYIYRSENNSTVIQYIIYYQILSIYTKIDVGSSKTNGYLWL
jgi:hypothetical protein